MSSELNPACLTAWKSRYCAGYSEAAHMYSSVRVPLKIAVRITRRVTHD
jgi:hypothetical protein